MTRLQNAAGDAGTRNALDAEANRQRDSRRRAFWTGLVG